MQTLTKPKEKGGIGLPDIFRYYQAVHLARIADWHCNRDSKQWVEMEIEDSSLPLLPSPWLMSTPPADMKSHPLIGATLQVARKVFRTTDVSPLPSPMTPIIGNPDFSPGLTSRRLRQLASCEKQSLGEIWPQGELPTASTLSRLIDPPLDSLSTLQLRHYLKTLQKIPYVPRSHTPLESLCKSGEPIRHTLSFLYSILTRQGEDSTPEFLLKWERDLGTQLTTQQRERVLVLAHKSSIASHYQEAGYKILTRWYRVPYVLHKMNPSLSDRCWRCDREEGSMLHVFWSCPLLRPFWEGVSSTIQSLTSVDLRDNPAACLLHLTTRPIQKYKKTLTMQLLNAAKTCIPALWRNPLPPTRVMWYSKVNCILRMEELTATLQNKEEQFLEKWRPWRYFVGTDIYLQDIAQTQSLST